jgi:hypothetical protein
MSETISLHGRETTYSGLYVSELDTNWLQGVRIPCSKTHEQTNAQLRLGTYLDFISLINWNTINSNTNNSIHNKIELKQWFSLLVTSSLSEPLTFLRLICGPGVMTYSSTSTISAKTLLPHNVSPE